MALTMVAQAASEAGTFMTSNSYLSTESAAGSQQLRPATLSQKPSGCVSTTGVPANAIKTC